jgi:undecaprenyl-diphosphatase
VIELIHAIILGIVQGATEFIPVSSSGHLVIVPWLLGWEDDAYAGLLFDTVLHWGTLVAIFWVFWRDFLQLIKAALRSIAKRSLADPDARIAWFIVIGSVPAAVTGLLLKDQIEMLFNSPRAAGFFLLVTAMLLAGSELLVRKVQQFREMREMKLWDAIFIGVAQAIALAPGISRSGSTIAAGLVRKFRRDEAARFSFFLGTPAFLGAGLLQMADTMATDASQVTNNAAPLIAGFVASAIAGVVAIRFLLAYLRRRSLNVFAAYCLVLGISVIVLSFVWT